MTSGAANLTPTVLKLIPNRLPPAWGAAVRPPISADSGNKTAVRQRRSYHRRRTIMVPENGLRSQRAGERCPPPPDLPARPAWFRRSRPRVARVRALAARRRPTVVADASGGPDRVRQFAVQRALGIRRQSASRQSRPFGGRRPSFPARSRRCVPLPEEPRRLRGGARLSRATSEER